MSRSLFVVVLGLVMLSAQVLGAQPALEWGYAVGNGGDQDAFDATKLSNGNVVVVGKVATSAVLNHSGGTSTKSIAGSSDLLAACYAPNGSLVWSQIFGGTGADDARAVAVGPNDEVYLAGTTTGAVTVGASSWTSTYAAPCIIQLAPGDGSVVAAVHFDVTGGNLTVGGLTVRSNGNVVLAVNCPAATSIDLDPSAATDTFAPAETTSILVELDSSFSFSSKVLSSGLFSFGGISRGSGASVLFSGHTNAASLVMSEGGLSANHTKAGTRDIVCYRWEPGVSLNKLASVGAAGASATSTRALATNSADEVFLGGYFQSAAVTLSGASAGTFAIALNGSSTSSFVAKCDSAGNALAAASIGPSSGAGATVSLVCRDDGYLNYMLWLSSSSATVDLDPGAGTSTLSLSTSGGPLVIGLLAADLTYPLASPVAFPVSNATTPTTVPSTLLGVGSRLVLFSSIQGASTEIGIAGATARDMALASISWPLFATNSTVTLDVGLPTPTLDSVTHAASANDIGRLVIADVGSGDAFASPTPLETIALNVASTGTFGSVGEVIWRVSGPDLAMPAVGVVGGTQGAETLTFSGLGISVADGMNENYTISAEFPAAPTNFVDGDTFTLTSTSASFPAVVGGSAVSHAGGLSFGFTYNVVATQLQLKSQPPATINLGSGFDLELWYTDVAGNRDLGADTDMLTIARSDGGAISSSTTIAVTDGRVVLSGASQVFLGAPGNISGTLRLVLTDDANGLNLSVSPIQTSQFALDVIATELRLVSMPSPLTTGVGADLVVHFTDANGVLSPSANGDVVTITRSDGGAMVQATSGAAVSGVASFTGANQAILGSPANTGGTLTLTFTDDSAGAYNLSGVSLTGPAFVLNAADNMDVQMSQMGSAPATLSSVAGFTTLFSLTIADQGGGDGLAAQLSSLTVHTVIGAGLNATDFDWQLIGIGVFAPNSVSASEVSFADSNLLTVADGMGGVVHLQAKLKASIVNRDDVDGIGLSFSVASVDVTTSGTSVAAGQSVTSASATVLDVVATSVVIGGHDTNLMVGDPHSLVASYRDGCGNLDLGVNGDRLSLSRSDAGALTQSLSAPAVMGMVGFSSANAFVLGMPGNISGTLQLHVSDDAAGTVNLSNSPATSGFVSLIAQDDADLAFTLAAPNPSSISSVASQWTTILSLNLSDGGLSDGKNAILTGLTANVNFSGSGGASNFAWRIEMSGAGAGASATTVSSTGVTFSGLNFVVPNGATRLVELQATVSASGVSGLDGLPLTANVSNANVTTGNGTSAKPFSLNTPNQTLVNVTATELRFVQPPMASVNFGASMDVVVAFTDARGNVDFHVNGDVVSVSRSDGGSFTQGSSAMAQFGIVNFTSASALTLGMPANSAGFGISFADDVNGTVNLSTSLLSFGPITLNATNDGDSILSTSFYEANISSAWTTPQPVWSITLADSGASDGLPTQLDGLTLQVNLTNAGTNSLSDFDFVLNGALPSTIDLADGTLSFTGLSVSATNGNSTVLMLEAALVTGVSDPSAIDGASLSVELVSVTSAAGSTGTATPLPLAMQVPVEVVATQLVAEGAPSSVQANLPFDVTVSARDAFGRTDHASRMITAGTAGLVLQNAPALSTSNGSASFTGANAMRLVQVSGSGTLTYQTPGLPTLELPIEVNGAAQLHLVPSATLGVASLSTTTDAGQGRTLMRFVLRDGDGDPLTSDGDSLDTTLSELRVQVAGSAVAGDQSFTLCTTVGATLANGTIQSGEIVFSNLSLVVPDDTQVELEVRGVLAAGIVQSADGASWSLALDPVGLMVASGSSVEVVDSQTIAATVVLDVVATRLAIVGTPPTTVSIGVPLPLMIEAVDQSGNRDLDAIHSISISRAGGLGVNSSALSLAAGLLDFAASGVSATGLGALQSSMSIGATGLTELTLSPINFVASDDVDASLNLVSLNATLCADDPAFVSLYTMNLNDGGRSDSKSASLTQLVLTLQCGAGLLASDFEALLGGVNATATASTLTFTGLNLSAPNGGSTSSALQLRMKPSVVNRTSIDGAQILVALQSAVFSASGTSVSSINIAPQFAQISVVATQLAAVGIPPAALTIGTSSVLNLAYVDSRGNRDTGIAGDTVTITRADGGSITVAGSASSGILVATVSAGQPVNASGVDLVVNDTSAGSINISNATLSIPSMPVLSMNDSSSIFATLAFASSLSASATTPQTLWTVQINDFQESDGRPTVLTSLEVGVLIGGQTTTTVSDFDWYLNGLPGVINAQASRVSFPFLNIATPASPLGTSASTSFQIQARVRPQVGDPAAIDLATLQLSIVNATTASNSTSLATSTLVESSVCQVEVVATRLALVDGSSAVTNPGVQQPLRLAMVDAAGRRDHDLNGETVTLSRSDAGAIDGNQAATVQGLVTFSQLSFGAPVPSTFFLHAMDQGASAANRTTALLLVGSVQLQAMTDATVTALPTSGSILAGDATGVVVYRLRITDTGNDGLPTLIQSLQFSVLGTMEAGDLIFELGGVSGVRIGSSLSFSNLGIVVANGGNIEIEVFARTPAAQLASAEGSTIGLSLGVGSVATSSSSSLVVQPTALSGTLAPLSVEANRLEVISGPVSLMAGSSATFVVEAQDAWGNRDRSLQQSVSVANAPVDLTGTVIQPLIQGRAVFTLGLTLAGNSRLLEFAAQSLLTAQSPLLEVLASTPTSLDFVTEPLTALAGQAFSTQPRLEAHDAFGNLSGEGVLQLRINDGGATLSGTTLLEMAGGVVAASGLGLTTAGTWRLRADGFGLSALSGEFTVAPSDPTQLVVVSQPTHVQAGVPTTTAILVDALDAFGNKAQLTGQMLNATSTVSLGGVQSATFSGGRASLSGMVFLSTGQAVLTLTGSGLQVSTQPINVVSGSIHELVVVQQPVIITAGETLGSVEVEARDASGFVVATSGLLIQVTTQSGAGVFGATLKPMSAGRAVFDDLVLQSAGSQSLSFVSAGADGSFSATSQPIEVLPADAASIVFVTQPLNVKSMRPMPVVIEVEVRDAFSNLVADGSPVELSAAGALMAPVLGNTQSGRVAFNNLLIGGSATQARLLAQVGEVQTQSGVFSVTPSPALIGTSLDDRDRNGRVSALDELFLAFNAELNAELLPLTNEAGQLDGALGLGAQHSFGAQAMMVVLTDSPTFDALMGLFPSAQTLVKLSIAANAVLPSALMLQPDSMVIVGLDGFGDQTPALVRADTGLNDVVGASATMMPSPAGSLVGAGTMVFTLATSDTFVTAPTMMLVRPDATELLVFAGAGRSWSLSVEIPEGSEFDGVWAWQVQLGADLQDNAGQLLSGSFTVQTTSTISVDLRVTGADLLYREGELLELELVAAQTGMEVFVTAETLGFAGHGFVETQAGVYRADLGKVTSAYPEGEHTLTVWFSDGPVRVESSIEVTIDRSAPQLGLSLSQPATAIMPGGALELMLESNESLLPGGIIVLRSISGAPLATAPIQGDHASLIVPPNLTQSQGRLHLENVYDLAGNPADYVLEVGFAAPSQPLIANAGLDRDFTMPSRFALDGSASQGFDSIHWTQLSGPVLSFEATSTQPTVTLTKPGSYRFRLEVFRGNDKASDDVLVTLANSPPMLDAIDGLSMDATEVRLREGMLVAALGLSARGFDANGDALTYNWTVIAVPANGNLSIAMPDQPSSELRCTDARVTPGLYRFQVQVNDLHGAQVEAEVRLMVTGEGAMPPSADAGLNRSVEIGEIVVLDANESVDVDGEGLSYLWSFHRKPETSGAILTASSEQQCRFVPDKPGEYVMRLITADVDGWVSGASFVQILVLDEESTVIRLEPEVIVGGQRGEFSFVQGASFEMRALPPARAIEGAVYAWSQLEGPSMVATGNWDSAVIPMEDQVLASGNYRFRVDAKAKGMTILGADLRFMIVPSQELLPTLVVNIDGEDDPDGDHEILYIPELGVSGLASNKEVNLTSTLLNGTAIGWLWRLVAGPSASLMGADSSHMRFVPLTSRVYTFEVVATLEGERQMRAEISLSVSTFDNKMNPDGNAVPVAQNLRVVGKASLGKPVLLSAEGSDANDGSENLIYTWVQVAGPLVKLWKGESSGDAWFTPVEAAEYRFALYVDDGADRGLPKEVSVVVEPQVLAGEEAASCSLMQSSKSGGLFLALLLAFVSLGAFWRKKQVQP